MPDTTPADLGHNGGPPLRQHSLKSAEFFSFCIFAFAVIIEMALKFVAAVKFDMPDLVLTDREDKLWLALGAGGVLLVRQVGKGLAGYGNAMRAMAPKAGPNVPPSG